MKKRKKLLCKKAFTLIELLIVIAVISLLAVTIFVVVDPARRIADAKETVRTLNTLSIEKAIEKAIAEEATVPTALASLSDHTPYMLVTNGGDDSGTCDCATLDTSITRIDIAGAFEDYLGSTIPVDTEATGDDTGYYISKAGNNFTIQSCNAYGDSFVQADPETITCYFDQYDAGGEEWEVTPADMVDNPSLNTAGQTPTPAGDVQLLTHSTCANQTFGTITQVRVRHSGYCIFGSCGTILRPVFSGTLDGDNNFVDDSGGGGWNTWVDITHNTNAPATWTTSDVVNLDLDVESASVGAGFLWTVFAVQLEVTHIPN
jgi:prepilin-type N-terminal cleavage/methylation domain-containing protein